MIGGHLSLTERARRRATASRLARAGASPPMILMVAPWTWNTHGENMGTRFQFGPNPLNLWLNGNHDDEPVSLAGFPKSSDKSIIEE